MSLGSERYPFLTMGDPQVTMAFDNKMVIHDLDDARGYPHDFSETSIQLYGDGSKAFKTYYYHIFGNNHLNIHKPAIWWYHPGTI